MSKVAIVGAGWAGLACAVYATRARHAVQVFEAARTAGGRARRIEASQGPVLDNGQHIMIGAYSATLALMRELGVDPSQALLRMPLNLRFADGTGLAMPRWPAPLDLLGGVGSARGWSTADKLSLLRIAFRWRFSGFRCAESDSVSDLCRGVSSRVMADLIEPLCVSALNTPVDQSSGQVFLRVLHDALFGVRGGADLLLPRVDLGRLLPDAAGAWLQAHGAALHLGHRVQQIDHTGDAWQVDGERFDHLVLACAPWDAARLVRAGGIDAADWLATAEGLRFEAITTVYAEGATRPLAAPMVALRSSPRAPAQFVFDRGQLGGPPGLLAFVVSASDTDKAQLEAAIVAQGAAQLNEPALRPVRTVVEKRATFACTPGLKRPSTYIAPGLSACGDYVQGPYPATLEGAIRCAAEVAGRL